MNFGLPELPEDIPYRDAGHEENVISAVWLNWRTLQACPDRGEAAVLKNRQAVLGAVRGSNGEAFQYADISLRRDPEVVLEVMQVNGLAVQWAADELKSNRDFMLRAVKIDGRALKYASPEIRGDRKVVQAATQSYGPALEYANEDLLSDSDLLELAANEAAGRGETSDAKWSPEAQREKELLAQLEEFRPPSSTYAGEKVGMYDENYAASEYDTLLESFQLMHQELRTMDEEIDRKQSTFAHLTWL
jgi:hypothetical protein